MIESWVRLVVIFPLIFIVEHLNLEFNLGKKEVYTELDQQICESINSKEELRGDDRENICGMIVMCTKPLNSVDLQFWTIYSIFVFSTAWLLTHLTQLPKNDDPWA